MTSKRELLHILIVWQAAVNVPLVLLGFSFGIVLWYSLVLAMVCGGYLVWSKLGKALPFFRALNLAHARGISWTTLMCLFCHRRVRVGPFTAKITLAGKVEICDLTPTHRTRLVRVGPLPHHTHADGATEMKPRRIRCSPNTMPWPDILVLYGAAPRSFYQWCDTVYL